MNSSGYSYWLYWEISVCAVFFWAAGVKALSDTTWQRHHCPLKSIISNALQCTTTFRCIKQTRTRSWNHIVSERAFSWTNVTSHTSVHQSDFSNISIEMWWGCVLMQYWKLTVCQIGSNHTHKVSQCRLEFLRHFCDCCLFSPNRPINEYSKFKFIV